MPEGHFESREVRDSVIYQGWARMDSGGLPVTVWPPFMPTSSARALIRPSTRKLPFTARWIHVKRRTLVSVGQGGEEYFRSGYARTSYHEHTVTEKDDPRPELEKQGEDRRSQDIIWLQTPVRLEVPAERL
jgi:hypothetical protein